MAWKIKSEKDLGVVTDHKLNINQQCETTTRRTNPALDCIRKMLQKSLKSLSPFGISGVTMYNSGQFISLRQGF